MGYWQKLKDRLHEAELQAKNKREEVGVPTTDPMAAAVWEHEYVAAHPCLCGGVWQMRTHDSPFPSGSSAMVCVCKACGGKKVFVFRLW